MMSVASLGTRCDLAVGLLGLFLLIVRLFFDDRLDYLRLKYFYGKM
jgi:hypothetical protein